MTKFFYYGVAALFLATLLAPIPVQAGQKEDNCGTQCDAWGSGHGARPGPPTTCIIEISAPTYGGQVGLDVRAAGRVSRWDAPRIKRAKPGTVTFKIGCGWLDEPTAEVYMCVKGEDGKEFYSIRLRSTGTLQEARRTRRLYMCLKGEKCSESPSK